MIAISASRVPEQTAEHVNAKIRRQMEERVARCAAQGPVAIDRRLRELDHEWDIERLLEANASSASLLGLTLGAAVDRRWYLLSAAVAAFLFQHAVQGWCPPVPVLRRLGFRTVREIDHERFALKALRGDFEDLPSRPKSRRDARRVLEAVRR